MAPLRIVADENIPLLGAFCGHLGTVKRVSGRDLGRGDLAGADVLLVRSVTRVDQTLLAGTPVRFVGTATIGTDHIDLGWLKSEGIAFSAAPGCNADSVVQYVLSVLSLFLQRSRRHTLAGLTVGVVGAGNVGSRLVKVLSGLGITVRVSDPPLEASSSSLPFASLEEVLACDVVSLHTPLIENGTHPTRYLLGHRQLNRLSGRQLLINSGRGAVIDNHSLLSRLKQPDAPLVALDVWENEPSPIPELVNQCWLATPHIAGYSVEGKSRGTEMIARALHQWVGVPMTVSLEERLPPPPVVALSVSGQSDPLAILHRALMTCYDPRDDDARLRKLMTDALADSEAGAPSFDGLRKHYPVRREPSSLEVRLEEDSETARVLSRAGFRVVISPGSPT